MVAGGAGAVGVLPSSVKYRSCAYAEEDDFLGLFHFWVCAAVYWCSTGRVVLFLAPAATLVRAVWVL